MHGRCIALAVGIAAGSSACCGHRVYVREAPPPPPASTAAPSSTPYAEQAATPPPPQASPTPTSIPPPPPPGPGAVVAVDPTCTLEAGRRQGAIDAQKHRFLGWGTVSCAANTVFPVLCLGVDWVHEKTPIVVPYRDACAPGWEEGYREGYRKIARSRREDAVIWGGIIGAGLWATGILILAIAGGGGGGGGHEFSHETAAPPGVTLIRFR